MARIACLFVPDLALAALHRAEPALRAVPLALTDGAGPRATITAVSDAAARGGVRTGITAAQGTAICTALALRAGPDLADHRRAARAALGDVAESCSPRVEDAAEGLVYLDVAGSPFPSEHALGAALAARAARVGLEARVGIAATKRTASLAARRSPGVTVVPRGAERRFLAPLPVGLLEPGTDLAAALARWGITRLSELACLSPGAVGTRLGPAGAALVRRARGEDDEPLVPRPAPFHFEEGATLEWGVDTLEPLVFVLRGCLDRLVARLALRGLAAGALRLSLGLATRGCEERTVALAAPTTDVKTLLTLARLHLEAAPPAAAVEALRAVAVPAAVRATQLDLFRPAGPAPERLATTVARLAAICGPGRVGAPAVADAHRPEAFGLAPFGPPDGTATAPGRGSVTPRNGPAPSGTGVCRLALRSVRPPRAVEVFAARGRPDVVRGPGLGGRIVALAGPWRLAGEWWTDDGFARDYYDAGLSDGAVYRLYRDLRTGRWYVDGVYD